MSSPILRSVPLAEFSILTKSSLLLSRIFGVVIFYFSSIALLCCTASEVRDKSFVHSAAEKPDPGPENRV